MFKFKRADQYDKYNTQTYLKRSGLRGAQVQGTDLCTRLSNTRHQLICPAAQYPWQHCLQGGWHDNNGGREETGESRRGGGGGGVREGGGRKKTVKKNGEMSHSCKFFSRTNTVRWSHFCCTVIRRALNLFLQTAVGSSLYTTGHLSP